MKDKLTKHHKKRSYFVVRNFLLILLAVSFSVAMVIVPVTVSISVHNANIALVK